MSEPKLISPMLDNFAMGDPISDRNGVRCCPAMENDTDNRYIVKIISNPPSQTQLDALVLSGAYGDKESALAYYKALSEDIIEEVNTLKKLSRLEGFIAFDNHQIVPIDDDGGYDVYLLSEYRNTLEQAFRHGSMTHLTALNLGLDLCAALAISRQSGYLYVDLKPDNIYLTAENTYRIGDIGFLKLNSLKYASLPDRYRSQYTAPEIADAFASLNTTMDVYALGLILYRVFNNGALPFHDDAAPAEEFPAPAYADYEMAEIILKACNPDPEARWQDPVEMGQALVSYMQRNGAHDTPIVAEAEVVDTDAEVEEHAPKYIAEEDTDVATETVSEVDTTEEAEVTDEEISEESIFKEDNEGNLTFIVDEAEDETSLEQDPEEIDYEEVSEEVSDMLNVADDLIAHQAPEPVVQPEPIDVPIPEPLPIVSDEEENEEAEENSDETSKSDNEVTEEDETETADEEKKIDPDDEAEGHDEESNPRKGKWLVNAILIIAALALIAAGIFCYKNYYLQPIESIVLEDIDAGNIAVLVSSQISEDKLSVICSDTYGNQLSSPVKNGKATFTGLSPNSAYTVKVVITGFHKLTGDTSAAFTTPTQTNIVQLQAVTGSEDGSAVVSFTIDGPDATEWKLTYRTENDDEKEVTFSGHMVTLTGLTVGSVYEMTLAPNEDIQITGTTQITHTANKIVKPIGLAITSCKDGALTAAWSAPEGVTVESWTVRCYNENGYDETKVVEETTAVFENIDVASAYTVEVSAAGMSVNERAFAPANSITVENFKINDSNGLTLSWECDITPKGGWLVLYTIDGSTSQEITCETGNTASLDVKVPGAKYVFTLQAADGTSGLLGNILYYTSTAAQAFSGYGLSNENMNFKMCKTPSFKGWDRWDLSDDDYTTNFVAGTNASFLIHANKEYSTSSDEIDILFVIRDENGAVVNTSTASSPWKKLWYRSYCELEIPSIPQAPGKYKISVFFNGALANEQDFTVTD